MKKYLIFLSCIVLMTACSVMPDPLPVSTVPPSVTPALTQTPLPTNTVTPTITPSPTSIYDYGQPVDSPNGKFSAKIRINQEDRYDKPVLELWNNTGELLWKVVYKYSSWNADIFPRTEMTIFRWSLDSSKIYFYYMFGYDGGVTLFDGSDLQSLDVYTGEVKDLVPGGCMAFKFSGDMNTIAYTSGGNVGVINVVEGSKKEIKILPHVYEQAGRVFLSPGGDKVIFFTLKDAYATVIFWDTKTMKQKIIMTKYIESFHFDGWTIDEKPQFYDSENNRIISIDLENFSQIVIGTPTPTPTSEP